ncbi:unnamed protein product, partial [Rotaria magnacalcarata]
QQFSIYNGSEENLCYQIQSQLAPLQKIEIIIRPSNQVVAKLETRRTIFLYEANISILDRRSNQWTNGEIQEQFSFHLDRYIIEWNSDIITMETGSTSFSTRFLHRDGGDILAQYYKRWFSSERSKKYDMKIYSTEIPETIYFLLLAVKDEKEITLKKFSEIIKETLADSPSIRYVAGALLLYPFFYVALFALLYVSAVNNLFQIFKFFE